MGSEDKILSMMTMFLEDCRRRDEENRRRDEEREERFLQLLQSSINKPSCDNDPEKRKDSGDYRLDPSPKMELELCPVQCSSRVASSKDVARGGRQLEARGPRRERSHSVGLRNYSSNDYMNSIIQCLFAIKEIRYMKVPQDGTEFMKSFRELLTDMGSETLSSADARRFLDCTHKVANKFAHYKQQDAHSFLMFLVKEIESCTTLDSSCKGLFSETMQTRYNYKCPKRHEDSVNEIINTFVIPCNKNVEDAFEDFLFRKERGGVMLCSKCQIMTTGSMTSKMVGLPKYCILLLSRFNLRTSQRDSSVVQFPLTMSYGKVITLKLFAICDHPDPYGHYTATVLDEEEGQWYFYDDERCSRAKAPNVSGDICRSSTAYILFYKNMYRSNSLRLTTNLLM